MKGADGPGAGGAARESAAEGGGQRGIASIAVEPLGEADGRGFREMTVLVRVRDGWHVAVTPDLPELEGVEAELADVRFPSPAAVAELPGAPSLTGFAGELVVRARVRLDAPRAAVRLRFVACGENACWPEATVEAPLG